MLGLKSFETAAVTFAGIELANRIRKQQFYFGRSFTTDHWSLKRLWDRALAQIPPSDRSRDEIRSARPSVHQNSRMKTRSVIGSRGMEPRRFARKIFDGRGLYLLVMPNGSRYWRYNYRFGGKLKTIALGVHPDVSLEKARARHQAARSMLADGIDPSARKRASGVSIFMA